MMGYFGTLIIFLSVVLNAGAYGTLPEQANVSDIQHQQALKECRTHRCKCSPVKEKETNEKSNPSVCGVCVLKCMKEVDSQ
ncbi:MAG: hypothetical protein JSS34_07930 [Proteobacteria bacterium]|nr:hypothetical protein [Pseudomonadota bacterium]